MQMMCVLLLMIVMSSSVAHSKCYPSGKIANVLCADIKVLNPIDSKQCIFNVSIEGYDIPDAHRQDLNFFQNLKDSVSVKLDSTLCKDGLAVFERRKIFMQRICHDRPVQKVVASFESVRGKMCP